MAIKTATIETPDEPFAFQCREFLRSRLVGKAIQFELVGISNGRHFLTITHEGQDIAALAISQGFGKIATEGHMLQPANMADLLVLEREAKEQKLGIWADELPAPRAIRWAQADVDIVKAFVEIYKGQNLVGIVESVRDGSCLRIYFLQSQVYAQCLLTGISCPDISNETQPFAREAKEYVELRLLGRSLTFSIDGCDDCGNIFATPKHARGSITELLLSEGFAKLDECSANYYVDQEKLRRLFNEARNKGLRRWQKSFPESNANMKESQVQDRDFERASKDYEGKREFIARVVGIFSADSLSVVPLSALSSQNNPAPREIIENERRIYLASIRCPKGRTRAREAEPYSREALELVKELCGAQKVKVSLDYIRTPIPPTSGAEMPPPSDDQGRLHFCTVYVKETSLNLELVRNGLAKTQRHRVEEERAADYAKFVEAEQAAIAGKVGMHSNKEATKYRINDLCGPTNAQKARAMEQSMTREDRISITVDYVINGSRYRCTAPELSCQFVFVLSGVRCPQLARQLPNGDSTSGQSYAEEAVAWARFHLLHRTFVVQINTCDRSGAFIGQMWHSNSVGKNSLNARLLRVGVARIDEVGIRLCPIAKELKDAEYMAVQKRVGVWALPESVDAWREMNGDDTFPEAASSDVMTQKIMTNMIISHVESHNEIYCQDVRQDMALEELQMALARLGDARKDAAAECYTIQDPPRKGEIVICQYMADNNWYRGVIKKVEGTSFLVFYIDYGNQERVTIDRLLKCPPEVNVITLPPFATCLSLAGISTLKEYEEQVQAFLTDLPIEGGKLLTAVTVGVPHQKTGALSVILKFTDNQGSSINQDVVAAGLARMASKISQQPDFPKAEADALKSKEKEAKLQRLGIWFYGDVGASDDEENLRIIR